MSEWPRGLTYRPIVAWPGTMTRNRRRSSFKSNLSATTSTLDRELAGIRGRTVVLQLALTEDQLRNDGLPRAAATPAHPGVILSMETPDGPIQFPCDTFDRWHDNLRAIVLTMEKLRAIDRYGVTKHGEQYRGWMQIEPPREAPKFTDVGDALRLIYAAADMIVEPGVLYEPDAIRTIIRRARFKHHPDRAGDVGEYHRIEEAELYLKLVGAI